MSLPCVGMNGQGPAVDGESGQGPAVDGESGQGPALPLPYPFSIEEQDSRWG